MICAQNARTTRLLCERHRTRIRGFLAALGLAALATVSCGHPGAPREGAAHLGQALNKSPQIGDFVVYGGRSVRLGKGVHSLGGDIGVATAAVSSFGTQLAVGAFDGLDVQHNLLSPSISLGAVSVVGDVQTNSLQNNGGAFHNQASFPASSMPRLPLAVGAAPGTTNVTVAPLQTKTLSPGNYGTLTDKGTVLLNPGAYSFSSVVLGEFAQLQAKSGGATTIFVTDRTARLRPPRSERTPTSSRCWPPRTGHSPSARTCRAPGPSRRSTSPLGTAVSSRSRRVSPLPLRIPRGRRLSRVMLRPPSWREASLSSDRCPPRPISA
jgi:hypothetical protein